MATCVIQATSAKCKPLSHIQTLQFGRRTSHHSCRNLCLPHLRGLHLKATLSISLEKGQYVHYIKMIGFFHRPACRGRIPGSVHEAQKRLTWEKLQRLPGCECFCCLRYKMVQVRFVAQKTVPFFGWHHNAITFEGSITLSFEPFEFWIFPQLSSGMFSHPLSLLGNRMGMPKLMLKQTVRWNKPAHHQKRDPVHCSKIFLIASSKKWKQSSKF